MDKQAEVQKIWQERFKDSRQWMTEVFSRIYSDKDALIEADADGVICSSMLLRPYRMAYSGNIFPVSYIYGATTRKQLQGKGYMSQLMMKALNESFSRGDIFCCLIPANRRLYGFYDRFGFATVFYVDEQRYTIDHQFALPSPEYIIEENVYDLDELAEAYTALGSREVATVLHDAADFKTILIDNSIDNGLKAIVRSRIDNSILAFAFATVKNDEIVVHSLHSTDEAAAGQALQSIKNRVGQKQLVVVAPPSRLNVINKARGMARIVNVEKYLTVLAQNDKAISLRVKVKDPIIEANNGCFVVKNGTVKRVEYENGVKVDYEANASVFTSIAFSKPHIGALFGLPTQIPVIELMLE